MARPMENPVIFGRVERALSQAQRALGELTTYGGNRADRTMAVDMWYQLEKMRIRLRGGR